MATYKGPTNTPHRKGYFSESLVLYFRTKFLYKHGRIGHLLHNVEFIYFVNEEQEFDRSFGKSIRLFIKVPILHLNIKHNSIFRMIHSVD